MADGCYRCLLAENPSLNGTTSTVELSLAELLVDKGDAASREEAMDLLHSWLVSPRQKEVGVVRADRETLARLRTLAK